MMYLEDEFFENLSRLQYLNLSGTSLRRIFPTFKHLKSLKNLELTNMWQFFNHSFSDEDSPYRTLKPADFDLLSPGLELLKICQSGMTSQDLSTWEKGIFKMHPVLEVYFSPNCEGEYSKYVQKNRPTN